jgi:hypothetical protein
MGQQAVESCFATCSSSLEFSNCKLCPKNVNGFGFGVDSGDDDLLTGLKQCAVKALNPCILLPVVAFHAKEVPKDYQEKSLSSEDGHELQLSRHRSCLGKVRLLPELSNDYTDH